MIKSVGLLPEERWKTLWSLNFWQNLSCGMHLRWEAIWCSLLKKPRFGRPIWRWSIPSVSLLGKWIITYVLSVMLLRPSWSGLDLPNCRPSSIAFTPSMSSGRRCVFYKTKILGFSLLVTLIETGLVKVLGSDYTTHWKFRQPVTRNTGWSYPGSHRLMVRYPHLDYLHCVGWAFIPGPTLYSNVRKRLRYSPQDFWDYGALHLIFSSTFPLCVTWSFSGL